VGTSSLACPHLVGAAVMRGGIRAAAVAGRFYPSDVTALRALIDDQLERATSTLSAGAPPKAIIAPHAGYPYSGPVAASAYASVRPRRGVVNRVVLLGPAHFAPLRSIAAPSSDAFRTPLGLVHVDTATRDQLAAEGLVTVDDGAHESEHSLEVHLPFVQVAMGEVEVLPLLVGQVPAAEVVAVLERTWDGPEVLVVASTDLSHYLDDATAKRVDRRTADAIIGKSAVELAPRDACGVFALQGLVAFAGERGLELELLDLRTSADTIGDPDRVVGYGSFAVR
jgi:AmmeMemoRadiSam system protein B